MSDALIEKINDLKKQRNAVILAHNYQLPEVQDIADYSGDSLELARRAKAVDCDVIVFCGVTFMAETACILNPGKTVVMPDPTAGCPLAEMVAIDELRAMKAAHPGAPVVCYVNSTAEIKAESDVCCTSANAVKVVSAIETDGPVIFVPDCHLGAYVREKTGRDMVLAKGYCPTHHHILPEEITATLDAHPGAVVIVHPECSTEVVKMADYVCSTSQMLTAVRDSGAKTFIIGTEEGMLHRLKKEFPDCEFFVPSSKCVCPNMKKTTLEKILWELETLEHKITVDPEISKNALSTIERMLNYV